jgi:hypothetical protein
VLYCNDGDWVESLTALVESETGELAIVHWKEIVELSTAIVTSDVIEETANANSSGD